MLALPLLLGDVLEGAGLGGGVAVAIMSIVSIYHFREALGVASAIGLWVRFGGVLIIILVIALSGVVPGLELVVDLGALGDAIDGVLHGLGDVLEIAQGVLPE